MVDHYAAPWLARDRFELRRDAKRFETWESNVAARLGLGVAVRYALDIGLDAIEARCRMLASRLRAALGSIDGVTVTDIGEHHASIISFIVGGLDADFVRTTLFRQGINVSVSRPTSTLLDALARHLPTVVRASPHYYNTEEEIDLMIDAISRIAKSA
jgi:selenocysteine lyase/cysteine desulfurase